MPHSHSSIAAANPPPARSHSSPSYARATGMREPSHFWSCNVQRDTLVRPTDTSSGATRVNSTVSPTVEGQTRSGKGSCTAGATVGPFVGEAVGNHEGLALGILLGSPVTGTFETIILLGIDGALLEKQRIRAKQVSESATLLETDGFIVKRSLHYNCAYIEGASVGAGVGGSLPRKMDMNSVQIVAKMFSMVFLVDRLAVTAL